MGQYFFILFQNDPGGNANAAMCSVMAVPTTPSSMSPVAASTGLSPLFHLARFKMGRAAGFILPPFDDGVVVSSQSVKSHRSKERSFLLAVLPLLDIVVVVVDVAKAVVLLVQSVTNCSSSARELALVTGSTELLLLLLLSGSISSLARRNSSKYSRTGPLRLLRASLVRAMGTT